MNEKKRLFYIDNIRLLMIVFVVVQHLAVTYSGMGSWYYKDGRPLGIAAQTLFGFYTSLQQGYFMGILFLIAGYFTPGAYDRKGFWRFLLDRFVRLGIPTLIYTFAVNPFIWYFLLNNARRPKTGLLPYYINYTRS